MSLVVSFVQPAMESPVFAVIPDMVVLVATVIVTTLAPWVQLMSLREGANPNTEEYAACVSPGWDLHLEFPSLDSRVVDGLPKSFQSEIPIEQG
jgi:hypothetical protein